MPKALLVPIHVDGLYLSRSMHAVPPFADFTRLPYVEKDADGRQWDANSSVPWITESVASEPLSALESKLEPGVHLHWALPDALTKATHPVDKDGKPDRGKVEFPTVPNRWLVVRRVSGIAQKRWLIESDYLWPADYPWGLILKEAFIAGLLTDKKPQGQAISRQQGQAIWNKLIDSGWLDSKGNDAAVVVDEHNRRSNNLGPYQIYRADILRTLHEKSAVPRHVERSLVSYPYPNVQPDSRPVPGEPPFRYLGRKREVGESWPQEGTPEYLKHIGHRLTAIGYGEPSFAAFYPNCRSVFGFHDAVEASPRSHQYDVYGWYSDSNDDVFTTFAFDKTAKDADGRVLNEDEQFWAWLEKRFNWTLDPKPESEFPKVNATICYGRVRSDSFVAAKGDNVNASIAPAIRAADPAARDLQVTEKRPEVHVAVANTGTEALSAYLADRLAWKRHPGDAHARAAEKRKIEEYLEGLQLADDLEHRLLDVGAKFAEKRHNKGYTASPGGTIWLIRARTDAPPAADVSKVRDSIEVSLPAELAHQLNLLNAAQREYERGRRSIEAMRWQVYSDWCRYMRNAYPPDDEALDYQASRDHHDVDVTIAYLRHGGVAVLDDLIAYTGELTLGDPPTEPTDTWQVVCSGSKDSLAGVLKGHIDQVSEAVRAHNVTLSKAEKTRNGASPETAKTRWGLEPIPAPRFYQPNDPVVLLAGGLARPTDRHGEDGRRHAKGHLECHVLPPLQNGAPKTVDTAPIVLDLPALQNGDAKEVDQDKAVIALDRLASKLMTELERDEPARIGFRRGRGSAGHPFMLEWQVEIAPVRSGSNMPSIGRRFDPWFIRNNWTLGENDCTFAERSGLTTQTDSCSVLRGRGFFTPQARTLLQSRLETYLLRRLKEYFASRDLPKDHQNLDYLRQNYTGVRAWFVRNGAETQAAADGRELDLLQKAAPEKAVHGIIEKGAIALAILRVVNDLPGTVLEEAVGLDPLTAQSLVIRRSGPDFLRQNYLAEDDVQKELMDNLQLDADLRPSVKLKFRDFVSYLMAEKTKELFAANAELSDKQANRLPDPVPGFATLVKTIIDKSASSQLYKDVLKKPQFPFATLKDFTGLQIMQADDGAAGAATFAKIIRFAHFNGYFGSLDVDVGIAHELPSVYGLPVGGPIEDGLLKLANEADKDKLINEIRLARNVVTELLLARSDQEIKYMSRLVGIPLVDRRSVALLLHYADSHVEYIELRAKETDPQIDDAETGAQFATAAPGGHAWSDPILTAIDAWYALNSGFHGVSQALTGFNDALLMRRRDWQLPIADPLTFTEYQAFTEKTIRRAVGQPVASPSTFVDFHPIRSGDMEITNLRLVDTFGQAREIAVNDVVTTNQMYTSRLLGVALPPRITQPARLNFRWLDAELGEQEWNRHPATTPICGWLVLNNLEARLMIYDTAGGPLGSVDQEGRWRPPPGSSGGVNTPDDIANAPLRRMVKWLCHEAEERREEGRTFIEKFVTVVESGLENIDPETFEHRQAQSLLMGRPLALVRAAVSIECRDPFAVQQSLEAFGRELQGQPRATDDFERVRFPVRIGEHMQLNDGVVGYWVEEGQDYAVTYQAAGAESKAARRDFFAPQSEWIEDEDLVVYREGKQALNLWLPISSPPRPQVVSILMDPRGSLHATCGVLPTKELTIPADEYAAALNAINVSFLTAPVLTARGSVNLPLPKEEGWQWSWIANRDGHWTTAAATPQVQNAAFQHAFGADDGDAIWRQLLDAGWLIALDDRYAEAQVAPAKPPRNNADGETILRNGRSAKDLGDYENQADAILRVIELSGRSIGRISTKAHFAEQELREGWLLLSPRHDKDSGA